MICEGECVKNPDKYYDRLNNFYMYDFKKSIYVCQECGDEKE